MTENKIEAGHVLVRETRAGKFQQEVLTESHPFMADDRSSLAA